MTIGIIHRQLTGYNKMIRWAETKIEKHYYKQIEQNIFKT